jgi:NAD(P)-dependent dehydrogenase (short-subunit alcohol dehydrogenase family)
MKICILTGGSKGLGKELLTALEIEGWLVYEISRSGSSTNSINCDLGKIPDVNLVIHELRDKLKKIIISEALLICNAGQLNPILRVSYLTQDELCHSVNLNILSHTIIINWFTKQFRIAEIKKTIINISSGAATKGYAGWSLYCMGKAAIENYTHAIYEEEKTEENPFRVFSVNPCVMDTQMQEDIRNSEDSQFPQKARFVKFKTESQLLSPKIVANSILDLIDDADSFDFKFDVKTYLDQTKASNHG